MHVSRLTLERDGDQCELSAHIDGFRLWYRVPADLEPARRGDAFLTAALLPAMRSGEDIELDEDMPVSPRLLQGIDRLQDIWRTWNPSWKKVGIQARAEPAEPRRPQVGSFFSGGVDGSYTFLKNADVITDLIFIRGVDMQLDNVDLFDQVVRSNQTVADRFNKRLVPVVSNLRHFCHPQGLPWMTKFQGPGLASVGLVLGLARVFIASTHTYEDLQPWPSHPLTDPLWSTEATQFIHDGAEACRSEKLRRVTACPETMAILRVCWQDAGYNCGVCEKCLRTRIVLRLLGVTTPTLPPLDSVEPVYRLMIRTSGNADYYLDSLRLAETVGDSELASSLRIIIRRYQRRRLAKEIDGVLCGGRLKKLYRKLVRRP